MRLLGFLIVLICCCIAVYGFSEDEHTDRLEQSFEVDSVFPSHEGVLGVSFNNADAWLTESERFIVRPELSNGYAEIFDKSSGEWISGNNFWSELPYLGTSLKIKLIGFTSKTTLLNLALLDSLTGQTYQTSSLKIWNRSYLNNYIERLNTTGVVQSSESSDEEQALGVAVLVESTESSKSTHDKAANTNKSGLVVSLAALIFFTVVGFYGDKIHW